MPGGTLKVKAYYWNCSKQNNPGQWLQRWQYTKRHQQVRGSPIRATWPGWAARTCVPRSMWHSNSQVAKIAAACCHAAPTQVNSWHHMRWGVLSGDNQHDKKRWVFASGSVLLRNDGRLVIAWLQTRSLIILKGLAKSFARHPDLCHWQRDLWGNNQIYIVSYCLTNVYLLASLSSTVGCSLTAMRFATHTWVAENIARYSVTRKYHHYIEWARIRFQCIENFPRSNSEIVHACDPPNVWLKSKYEILCQTWSWWLFIRQLLKSSGMFWTIAAKCCIARLNWTQCDKMQQTQPVSDKWLLKQTQSPNTYFGCHNNFDFNGYQLDISRGMNKHASGCTNLCKNAAWSMRTHVTNGSIMADHCTQNNKAQVYTRTI